MEWNVDVVIEFLNRLKKATSNLNIDLHDLVARKAVEYLKKEHKELSFDEPDATKAGFDIQGKTNGELILIGEVKTTGNLGSTEKRHIRNDIERLKKKKAKFKYFVVIDDEVEEFAEANCKSKGIEVINILKKKSN